APAQARRAHETSGGRPVDVHEGGDHGRATYQLRTGNVPQGGIDFPCIGSLLAQELLDPAADLPPVVSIAPQRVPAPRACRSGFLGPQYAPLLVADGQGFVNTNQLADLDRVLKVQGLAPSSAVSPADSDARLELMRDLESDFLAARPGGAAESHKAAYASAVRLMRADAAKVFDLSAEKEAVREQYGRTLFGQSCLLARRLVERGVPFVEVNMSGVPGAQGGWDTHTNNFEQLKALTAVLDKGWASLMADLKDRGLLETTTIVWMGEFGRTPKINQGKGRDHYAPAWSVVLGGGGIKGGQAVGKTS